jgi:hypothetical protein
VLGNDSCLFTATYLFDEFLPIRRFMADELQLWKYIVKNGNHQDVEVLKVSDPAALVDLLRKAFAGSVADTIAALDVVKQLPVELQMQLFGEVTSLCITQKFQLMAEPILLALPREWVLEHVERHMESHLQNGDNIDYSLIIQLFRKLDRELLRRTALRALQSEDADIREVGKDALDSITK